MTAAATTNGDDPLLEGADHHPQHHHHYYNKKTILPTGCVLDVNENRTLIELPTTTREVVVVPSPPKQREQQQQPEAVPQTPAVVKEVESWNAISSAIWNGGFRSFRCCRANDERGNNDAGRKGGENNNHSSQRQPTNDHRDDDNKHKDDESNNEKTHYKKVRVLNCRVPSTYDGLDPDPKSFLRTAIKKERSSLLSLSSSGGECGYGGNEAEKDEDKEETETTTMARSNTIGLMTAASMKSVRVASRYSRGVKVDVVVTAGISNARTVGADADCLEVYSFSPPPSSASSKTKEGGMGRSPPTTTPSPPAPPSIKPGTINTIAIVNAPLSPGAAVEAYAILVEGKCAACADLNLRCAKSSLSSPPPLAQGTGTDCAVLLSPSSDNHSGGAIIEYAGKHTLVGEMLGQAVREATREAVFSDLRRRDCYCLSSSSMPFWMIATLRAARGFSRACANLALRGARPCVPPEPSKPVPPAPTPVILFGSAAILFSRACVEPFLGRSASVLVAAAFWDRCLPELPLVIHPVCLVGTAITVVTKRWVPDRVYQNPFLGFTFGVVFLVGMLSLSTIVSWFFLYTIRHLIGSTTNHMNGIKHQGFFCWMNHAVATITTTITNAAACDARETLFTEQNKNNGDPLSPPPPPPEDFVSWLLEVTLLKSTFSFQLLCTVALQMAKHLERCRLKEARDQLSWLCSRDPTNLNAEELAGGTIESLSENLSDGAIAPWFWYVFLGPVGAIGYRVANTLDSRVGYRGGRYEWFGKASARFDDLINLFPSRLTAAAICFAALILSQTNNNNKSVSALNGARVAWEDRHKCSSPNAGWPMGAMAGTLGVLLEKKGEYRLGGNLLSPGARQPGPRDIRNGHLVAQLAGGLAFVFAVTACVAKGK